MYFVTVTENSKDNNSAFPTLQFSCYLQYKSMVRYLNKTKVLCTKSVLQCAETWKQAYLHWQTCPVVRSRRETKAGCHSKNHIYQQRWHIFKSLAEFYLSHTSFVQTYLSKFVIYKIVGHWIEKTLAITKGKMNVFVHTHVQTTLTFQQYAKALPRFFAKFFHWFPI